MAAIAALVRFNVGPSTALSGRPGAERNQRQRQAACSGLRDHKVLCELSRKPATPGRLLKSVSRRGRLFKPIQASDESTSEGAAIDPSTAARLVKDDTAAALNRQLYQSEAREKELAEGGGERPESEESGGHEKDLGSKEESKSEEEDFSGLKGALLARVAGLDRGVAAEASDRQAVESAASALESAGPGLDLPSQLEKLDGRWRLVYTSSFSSGSFGGSRPGPPFAGSNLKLGQVFQRINVARRELDNIVELQIKAPLPLLPPGEVTATLAHSFEVAGPSDIRITFEETRVRARGLLQQLPEITLPSLPDFLRSGTRDARSSKFATTFVDDQLRVSRGDRGELRIFVKSE